MITINPLRIGMLMVNRSQTKNRSEREQWMIICHDSANIHNHGYGDHSKPQCTSGHKPTTVQESETMICLALIMPIQNPALILHGWKIYSKRDNDEDYLRWLWKNIVTPIRWQNKEQCWTMDYAECIHLQWETPLHKILIQISDKNHQPYAKPYISKSEQPVEHTTSLSGREGTPRIQCVNI
jgi:hypothetical protein